MWSDTLFAAERSHLIRLELWAAVSAVIGTGIIATLTVRRMTAPIVLWFGIQSLAWGLVELVLAAIGLQGLAMRDISGATRLDRLTWFTAGLDVGIVATGVAVIAVAWMFGRRFGPIGAGLGIVVQGLGLLVMNLTFASLLSHLV
jgi:hypothetical protein